jgi:hypothetical protein
MTDVAEVTLEAPTEAIAGQAAAAEPLQEVHIEPLDDTVREAAVASAAALMDQDQFFAFLSSTFIASGNMIGFIPPLNRPMQSLIRAPNLPTARPASDAIYELALEHAWLRWLLDPQQKTFITFMAIAAWGAQVAMNVRAEVVMRERMIIDLKSNETFTPKSDEGDPAHNAPPQPAAQGGV